MSAGGRRTCDGVVELGRAEEEAVGAADPVAEGPDGGWEPEVGVEQRQVGDVDVLHAQARDGLLAHLRRWLDNPKRKRREGQHSAGVRGHWKEVGM